MNPARIRPPVWIARDDIERAVAEIRADRERGLVSRVPRDSQAWLMALVTEPFFRGRDVN